MRPANTSSYYHSGSSLRRSLVAFRGGQNTDNMQKGEIGKGGERHGRDQPGV
jgi:hypothetical protein